MRLVLFEPDIPQNTGAAIRAAACFGAGLEIIEPCGFPLNARDLRRVAMDYGNLVEPVIHDCWDAFVKTKKQARLILMTTKSSRSVWTCEFRPDDIILLGRESAGVPDAVHDTAGLRLMIPMASGARSLNVATSGAIVLAEASRQFTLSG